MYNRVCERSLGERLTINCYGGGFRVSVVTINNSVIVLINSYGALREVGDAFGRMRRFSGHRE
jgi:hypothetical protein